MGVFMPNGGGSERFRMVRIAAAIAAQQATVYDASTAGSPALYTAAPEDAMRRGEELHQHLLLHQGEQMLSGLQMAGRHYLLRRIMEE